MNYISDVDETDCGDGDIADANQTVTVSRPKQPKMMNFLDNVTAADATTIDTAIAEFFYGCNIPFAVADSVYFKKMLQAIRPAYVPPNRKKIAGPLLNTVQ